MQLPLRNYWHLLRRYLRPLWLKVALLGLLLAGSILMQLYNPRVLKEFIDTARDGATGGRTTVMALLFLGLALANQLLSVCATYVSQDVGWRATNQLRADLTQHALKLDLAFHKGKTSGEMIERIDGDVTILANFFSQFLVAVVANGILLIGVLLLLYGVDWRAGLALSLFAAVNLAALLRTRSMVTPGWQVARQASAEYFGFLGERLAGTEEIRANGAAAFTLVGFAQHMRRRLEAELKASRGMAAMLLISFGLMAVGMTTAFGISAYLVTTGAITIGTGYMIFYYTEQLRRPVEQIVNQMQDFARAGAAVARIQELAETSSSMPDNGKIPLPAGALSVDAAHVSFSYSPGARILHNVTFMLQPGQVLGVLGRTGSGKSTLARILARLYDPDDGSIRLGGVHVRDVRLSELRQRVGVVTQDVQLFQGTLRDNLTMFDRTLPDTSVWNALREVGLVEWAKSLPTGLDTELASGAGLSAGEGQLLAFARVFLMDPGLVILDEPSSRLDPVTEHRLERAVDRLLKHRTAIVIAHRLATLQRADQILVLEDGCTLEQGARSALMADPASRFYQLLQQGLGEALA